MSNSNKKSSVIPTRFPHAVTGAIKENKEESVSFNEWVIKACKQRLALENDIDIDHILAVQEKTKQLEKNRKIEEERLAKKEKSKMKRLEKKEKADEEKRQYIKWTLDVLKKMDLN